MLVLLRKLRAGSRTNKQRSLLKAAFEASTGQASTVAIVPLVSDAANAMVSAATPAPIQAGAIVPRRRFQKGNIIIRGKTPRRYGMYREDVLHANGTFKRVRRCVLLGPVSSISDRAAWKSLSAVS